MEKAVKETKTKKLDLLASVCFPHPLVLRSYISPIIVFSYAFSNESSEHVSFAAISYITWGAEYLSLWW